MDYIPKNICIVDSTLRDGEQAPGVAFSVPEKMLIGEKLIQSGVSEIEAGIPVMNKNEQEIIKSLTSSFPDTIISAWCRLKTEDIKAAEKAGAKYIHISFPPYAQIGEGTADKRTGILDLVLHAAKNFEGISIGLQDVFRFRREYLKRILTRISLCSIRRLRLADTVGIALPWQVSDVIKYIKSLGFPELEFHAHNDLGMATANSIVAVHAGANAISATVNGIGERAGNACLAELVAALHLSKEYCSAIDLSAMKKLSKLVEVFSGRPVSSDKPLVGKYAFAHESGIHCNALLSNELSYQPLLPKEVGRNGYKFVIGKHSGSSLLNYYLRKDGGLLTKDQVLRLRKLILTQCEVYKKELSEQNLIDMYNNNRDKVINGEQ